MGIGHPLQRIAPGRVRVYIVPLAALTLLILVLLPWVLPDRDTHTVLDLVAAGTPRAAAEVLAHWSEADRIRLSFGLGLDFVLNPAYATVAALACIWASRRFRRRIPSQLGLLLAWLAWSVIATNVVENVALLDMLLGSVATPWPELARLAHLYAGLVLFGMVLPYVLLACAARRRE